MALERNQEIRRTLAQQVANQKAARTRELVDNERYVNMVLRQDADHKREAAEKEKRAAKKRKLIQQVQLK